MKRLAAVLQAVLAGAAVLLLAAPVAAETISIGTYRARLSEVQARLRSGDWIAAREKARRLLADRVAYGGDRGDQGALEPDASVLGPIARAGRLDQARASSAALDRLIAALPEASPEASGAGDPPVPAPDPKLLKEVEKRQALAELPEGGLLPEVQDRGLLAALAEFLKPAVDFFEDLLERLWEWLLKLFPERSDGASPLGLDMTTVTALVVALAVILAWVGWRVLRNRRRGAAAPPAGPAPLPPAADDDPLSREASEWERYARELAAAGRAREAIRAWYHAVLVALYRAGALHYRKGRTNWEYVSQVPPGLSWRAGFAELTRSFEREWYGRDQSEPEALRESEGMALHLLTAVRDTARNRDRERAA